MRNSDIDSPVIEARKKYGKIVKPDLDCKKCKGKGEGNAELRSIVACPECYAGKIANTELTNEFINDVDAVKDQLDDRDLEYKKPKKSKKK